MATFSSVNRQHVLQALAEHDERGTDDFLEAYGFRASAGWSLQHEGRDYDAKAVLGVAHRFATGRLATPDEVDNSLTTAIGILRKRGFDVTEPATSTRAIAPSRTTTARAPRASRATGTTATTRTAAPREATQVVCPTCFTILPATGRCDTCS